MRAIKFIIILFIYSHLSAQTYFPLPDSNAVWTTYHYGQFGTNTMKYGIFGDTLINGFTYKKVYENYDYNFNLANSTYKGAIRESNKKVYIRHSTLNIETVLYDFTLNVGDTAKITTYQGWQNSYKVSAIDSIDISGQYHKRWKFNSAGLHYEEYWIEGIGSTFGLLLPLWQGSDNCYTLLCASQNNSIFYQYIIPGNPQCYSHIFYDCDGVLNATSISEINSSANDAMLFPNPFSNYAVLKTNIELTNATLNIYDLFGREILSHTNLNGKEIKIDRENLSAGNYYYKLTQNGNLIFKNKMIIE